MILFVALALLQTSISRADVVLNFNPSSTDGGVQLTGIGSGMTTGVNGGDNSWDFTDFNSEFLVAGVGEPNPGDFVSTQIVTGFIRNISTNTTSALTSVSVDKDPGVDGDDIRLFTPDAISFAAGDEFEISVTALWPEITSGSNESLLFSQLIPGTHTLDEFGLEEIFGDISISVSSVPEPSSFLPVAMTTGLLGLKRRRTRVEY